jgi:hypothetical protein
MYEGEISFLTDKLNETQNLEFLVQNSTLTSKWRKEADAYANTSQTIFNEFMAKKKELRYKPEQDRFEASKFIEFKVQSASRTKEEATKLYNEVIIVHFYDFYLKFEKWMSDLIKLHNDIMSVHQKLIECDKALNTPYEFQRIDTMIDLKINHILEMILIKKNEAVRMEAAALMATNAAAALNAVNLNQHHGGIGGGGRVQYSPSTPPQTICSNNSSKSNSIETRHNAPHLYTPPATVSSSSSSAALGGGIGGMTPHLAQHLPHPYLMREDSNNLMMMKDSGDHLANLMNFKFAQNNVDNLMNKFASFFVNNYYINIQIFSFVHLFKLERLQISIERNHQIYG